MANPDGTGRTVVADEPGVYESLPAWAPDGRTLAFTRDNDIVLLDVVSGQQTPIHTDGIITYESSPSFSPDGRLLAFLRENPDENNCSWQFQTDIFIVDLETGAETQFTNTPCGADGRVEFSPDGTRVAYESAYYNEDFSLSQATIFTRDLDGGEPVALTDETLAFNPSWSPDGQTIAYEGLSKIYARPAAGGEAVDLIVPPDCFANNPAWSPDGTRIAYASCQEDDPDEEFDYDIYVANADGSDPVKITDGPGYEQNPSWGPVQGAGPTPPGGGEEPPGEEPPGEEPPGEEPPGEEPPGEEPPGEEPGGEGGFDGDPATTEAVEQGAADAAAIEIAQARFADADGADGAQRMRLAAATRSAQYVVLSRDDAFPDSLAGAPLSADGPLLFTGSATLTPATADEIERVLPVGGTVYLLGGEAAISAAIENGLKTAGYDVRRLAGASRTETSVAVANEVRARYPATTEAALARAFGLPGNESAGWADSVTGGGWAASRGVPILVTGTEDLHPAVAAWLAGDAPSQTVLLGGEAALSATVADKVPNPRRVAGAERAATAAAISADLWTRAPSGERRYVVINGFHPFGWAFGLAAGGLAADAGAPVLVVGDEVPEATAQLVGACGDPQVDLVVIGDQTIVSSGVRAGLDDLDGSACA